MASVAYLFFFGNKLYKIENLYTGKCTNYFLCKLESLKKISKIRKKGKEVIFI